MPTVDLRALAERLGMVRPCRCEGLKLHYDDPEYEDAQGDYICECNGTNRRLPTEAEVRAAIFEAGWPVILMRRIEANFVLIEVCRPSEQRDESAVGGEADPEDLVLLALLRALEVARG